MNYLIPLLTVISYICSIFFVTQEQRTPLERPLVYGAGNLLWIPILLFGLGPMIIAGYLSFLSFSWPGLLALMGIRFIILPTFFNKVVKDFMDRKGI